MLKNKNITVHVTGGIAIYKVCDLVRILIKQGANVKVTMTKSAQEFISPLTFQILSKNTVYTDIFTEENPQEVAHIHLADWTDIAVVAPATANTMAKMANGIADNMTTATLLATTAPIFVVPAMNSHMYENAATQNNIGSLAQKGYYVMEPDTGFLAEGYEGQGRYPENERVISELEDFLKDDKKLTTRFYGKEVLVTAGGTKERIDPVRYITNDSSGKMGHAIAEAAHKLGAHVTLVTASNLPANEGIERVSVASAQEMYNAVDDHFSKADVLIMSAAVSDYTPVITAEQKMKKDEATDEAGYVTLRLKETPDILKSMGQKKEKQILVGFAAETQNIAEYAKKKLSEKNLDVIIANDVSKPDRGFNVDTNEVIVFDVNGKEMPIPHAPKTEIAYTLLDYLADNFLGKRDEK